MNTPTSTQRIDALNAALRDSKPYRVFVAAAEVTGHTWKSDADLEAFEAKVAGTLKWDAPLLKWGGLWTIAAKHILDGRLQWLNQFPHVSGEQATYFEEEPGAEFEAAPRQCACVSYDAHTCHEMRMGETSFLRDGCECICVCHKGKNDWLDEVEL